MLISFSLENCLTEFASVVGMTHIEFDDDGIASFRVNERVINICERSAEGRACLFTEIGTVPSFVPDTFYQKLLGVGYPNGNFDVVVGLDLEKNIAILKSSLSLAQLNSAYFQIWLEAFITMAERGTEQIAAEPPRRNDNGLSVPLTHLLNKDRPMRDLTLFNKWLAQLAAIYGVEGVYADPDTCCGLVAVGDARLPVYLCLRDEPEAITLSARLGTLPSHQAEDLARQTLIANLSMPECGPHFSLEAATDELFLRAVVDISHANDVDFVGPAGTFIDLAARWYDDLEG